MFTTVNNNKYKNICTLDMVHVKKRHNTVRSLSSSWWLCSTGTSHLLVPPVKQSTIGSCAFPVAGPKTRNALPSLNTPFSASSKMAFQEVFSGRHHPILTVTSGKD